MSGGTFTITHAECIRLSRQHTPFINEPQSAILGMHNIQDRPGRHQRQIVIRPMMYLALSL
jgi:2-oxoglutarate dehydrogenase E2 component (dihydrolipoamide succinyltransferase)